MKTVIATGPFLTQSGYGCHARQCARWLLSREDLDVKFVTTPWGDVPWMLDSNLQGGLVGEIMKRSVAPGTKGDVTVSVQLPNEWRTDLAPANVGVTAGVETDRCNPEWVAACNKMTAVVVPSQHAKLCLTNTGAVTVPLHVVPEAYSDAIVLPSIPEACDFETPFNFLVFGQLTGNNPENDRKNVFYTIKWLCEAFKADPEVGVVVKTNVGKNSRFDRQATKALLTAVVNESRKNNKHPNVYLLHGDMSDAEVASLYRHPKVKALVALTRGEGYGLPILEAAASGLPVIATSWSGHLDFMDRGKWIRINHQLNEVHPTRVNGKIFVKGARWANPSEEDAKKRLVKFRQSSSVPRQWATDLQKTLLPMYSAAAVEKLWADALKGIV